MVGQVGFEPTTLGLKVRCSDRLSYWPRRVPSVAERAAAVWLGWQDSNLRSRIQSPLPYRLATPQPYRHQARAKAAWDQNRWGD